MHANAMRPVEVLLVEDSPADVRLTQEVLREARVANKLHVVHDGEQALAFLRGEPPYSERRLPDMLLLDLNLPRKGRTRGPGRARIDPQLRHLPVVVLTTSASEADVLASYKLNVNAYVTKPVDLDQFIGVVRSIEGFWLSIVRFPPKP